MKLMKICLFLFLCLFIKNTNAQVFKGIKYTLIVNDLKNKTYVKEDFAKDLKNIKTAVLSKYSGLGNEFYIYTSDRVAKREFIVQIRKYNLGIIDLKESPVDTKDLANYEK